MKILIVEDEGLIANTLAHTLQRSGYEVSGIASSGEEALDKAKSLKPDIVLMDIHLSGTMDGIEVAEQVRSKFSIPGIFLTAHANEDCLNRAKHTYPFGYLVKPIRPADLVSAIEIASYKHHMEQKVKQRDAWLSTTLLSLSDGVVVTDAGGRIKFLNELSRRILGIHDTDVIGKNFCDVVKLKDRFSNAPAGDLVQLAILQGTPISIGPDLILVDSSHGEANLEGDVAPCEIDGSIVGTVFTFRDVTIRDEQDNQRRQDLGTTACARLATALSVELRTLLNASLESTEKQVYGDSGRRQLSEVTKTRQIELLTRIVDQLDIVRRRTPSFPSTVNLNTIIADRNNDRLGLRSNITLNCQLHPELPLIRVDPVLIKQAITDLILHAQDCMPTGGTIDISTRNFVVQRHDRTGSAGNYVRLTITNTSFAMNADEAHRLFEPFSGAGPSADKLDLRLFIVHEIISAAGGSIRAKMTPEQRMSFDILLPRAARTTALTSSAESTGNLAEPAILLLHADHEIRRLISERLEQSGYEPLRASDFGEALEWMNIYPASIAVLIADLDLYPSGDPAMIDRISLRYPGMKFVFMVNPGSSLDVRTGWIEKGATFVEKPFRLEELITLLNTLVASLSAPGQSAGSQNQAVILSGQAGSVLALAVDTAVII